MSKKRTSGVLVADPDPAVTVTSVAAGVSKNQAYVSPTDAERVDACIGLARLAIGDLDGAAELLRPLGFTLTTDVDPTTSRRYALAVSETQTPRALGALPGRPDPAARVVRRCAAPEVGLLGSRTLAVPTNGADGQRVVDVCGDSDLDARLAVRHSDGRNQVAAENPSSV